MLFVRDRVSHDRYLQVAQSAGRTVHLCHVYQLADGEPDALETIFYEGMRIDVLQSFSYC